MPLCPSSSYGPALNSCDQIDEDWRFPQVFPLSRFSYVNSHWPRIWYKLFKSNVKKGFYTFYVIFRAKIAYLKISKITMWGNIEMEVPFTSYTANYLIAHSQITCSVLDKCHFHFYLSVHVDFGFFLV